MKTKTITVTTNEVTQAQVWKLISDINNWSNWDDSIEASSLDGEFKTGNTFLLKPKGAPKVKIHLDEVKPNTYFRDLTRFPLAKMYGEHWYEETPAGLKITIKMTIEGILSGLWNMIVMKDITNNLEKDIALQIENAKKIKIEHGNR